MAKQWIRLDVAQMQFGWVADLPQTEFACWVKLLLCCKAAGVRGSIKASYFNRSALARLNLTRKAWTAMLEKAAAAEAICISEGTLSVTNWNKYQRDQTAAERQRRKRENDATEENDDNDIKNEGVTVFAQSHGCHGRRDSTVQNKTGHNNNSVVVEIADVCFVGNMTQARAEEVERLISDNGYTPDELRAALRVVEETQRTDGVRKPWAFFKGVLAKAREPDKGQDAVAAIVAKVKADFAREAEEEARRATA